MKSDHWESWVCLALTYEVRASTTKLTRRFRGLCSSMAMHSRISSFRSTRNGEKAGQGLDWLERR